MAANTIKYVILMIMIKFKFIGFFLATRKNDQNKKQNKSSVKKKATVFLVF
jgi:glucose uptake protein GlcU